MEEGLRHMETAVNDILNDMNKKCLRNLRIQMHQCVIECYRDSSNNMKLLEVCTKNCSKEAIAAQNYIQNEFNKWQNRIQCCVQDCDDAVMADIPSDKNWSKNMNKYIKEADGCASQCFLPTTLKYYHNWPIKLLVTYNKTNCIFKITHSRQYM